MAEDSHANFGGGGKFRYRLLAIDVDGTLVNSRDELTPTTQAAIETALAAGVKVVLATGRRYSRTLPLVRRLKLDVPLITASGALIKHPTNHETLFRAEFDSALLREMLAIIAGHDYDAVLYSDSYAEGFDYFCRSLEVDRPELAGYLAVNPGCHRVQSDLMTNPPDGVFAGFVMGTRAEMLALHDTLQERLPGQLYTHVLRSPRYAGFMCEIAPHEITKWSGVRKLAETWGIGDEQICAVGDDVNDIPMILGAGLGVAMGNAADEVKAVADRVAPSHDEDGLATVVDWLLAANRGE